jgi:Phage integrase, N-terminal SAM-like domain
MGYSRKRIGRDGKPRYTAYYFDIRGRERSAGTFSNRKDANNAWQDAESKVRAGKRGDPKRGRQTFARYVLNEWLPNHLLEPGVRSNYLGQIRKHLIPFFGPIEMRDIFPEQVREWVTLMRAEGASGRTIQYCKQSILNAIFSTALDAEVVTIHPSRGAKTPPVPEARNNAWLKRRTAALNLRNLISRGLAFDNGAWCSPDHHQAGTRPLAAPGQACQAGGGGKSDHVAGPKGSGLLPHRRPCRRSSRPKPPLCSVAS